MHHKPMKVLIQVDDRLPLKDPVASEVGRQILEHSILLLDEIGFEGFTFKKLATRIGITEPTVYRYFENKHKLLLYLISWYWNWLEYKIILATGNIASPEERLRLALVQLSQPLEQDDNYPYIHEAALYHIVIAESSKVYLTKEVDKDNREGFFLSYKRLCSRIADIIREINPAYRFPTALVSTVIESAHNQMYFAEHLPSLTEVGKKNGDNTTEYLTELVFKVVEG